MAPPPGLFKVHTEAENQAIKDLLQNDFQRTEMIYKTLRGVSFTAAVLVPQTVASSLPRKSPLLIHWHGGGLVVGEPLGIPMIARWVLELAAQQGAVIVSPTYRLIPEATGSEIIEDLQDFWAWARHNLPSAVSSACPGLEVELNHLAVTGESAGGFLSLQSAALFADLNIRVVIAQYPGMDPAHPAYNARPSDVDPEDDAFVTNYINSLEPGAIRISSPFPEKLDLMLAMLKTGRHREVIGNDKRMRLGDLLREGKTLPPIWIAQGADDKVVPKVVTDYVVANIRETHPDTPLLYTVEPGLHGFDTYDGLDAPWLQEGIEFVKKYW